ncbi:MAG: hypothetical protein CM15mP128_1810 [Methanobacteriota archaeon]|nr:MAG: hypothetical protein CM15mP128_1810 [Euryarchaeota archaeon]
MNGLQGMEGSFPGNLPPRPSGVSGAHRSRCDGEQQGVFGRHHAGLAEVVFGVSGSNSASTMHAPAGLGRENPWGSGPGVLAPGFGHPLGGRLAGEGRGPREPPLRLPDEAARHPGGGPQGGFLGGAFWGVLSWALVPSR